MTTISKQQLHDIFRSIPTYTPADPDADHLYLPESISLPQLVEIAVQFPDLLGSIIVSHGDKADDSDFEEIRKRIPALDPNQQGFENEEALNMVRAWLSRVAMEKIIRRL